MPVILFILTAILILILVSGGYVFLVGCVRRKELPWFVEDELKKTPYGKYYEHIINADNWLKTHKAEDVYITSEDGLRLHGLWVGVDNARATVLLVHGYRSSMLVDFGLAFEFYHSMGFNLLIPDQRSHGKSQGWFITFGVKESRDMLGWLKFHNEHYGAYPLLLSGLSMGASTVMYMADEDLPENTCAIIADCGFTSPQEILSSVYTRVTHLPARPSIYAAELFARLLAGFSLWEKDTRKTLTKNKLPILMVHGMADDFVPCKMTEEAFAVCAGEKKLLLVDNAGHGVSFLVDRQSYGACVEEMIRHHVLTEKT